MVEGNYVICKIHVIVTINAIKPKPVDIKPMFSVTRGRVFHINEPCEHSKTHIGQLMLLRNLYSFLRLSMFQ